MSYKNSKIVAAVATLLLLAAGSVYFFWARKKPTELQVGAPVRRGDMVQRVTMSGTIFPKRKSLVYAPYKGFIGKLFVNLGASVNPGDPLVTVSETLGQTHTQFPLRSPIKGTVVQLEKSVGEPVRGDIDAREFIMRIDDLSSLHVQATTTELDRVKVRENMEATIRIVALPQKNFRGRIESIDLAAKEGDPNNPWASRSRVEFEVRAALEDPDASVRPGMGVIMDVITEKKENALMIAHPYILRKDGKFFVTKADGKQVEVKVGLQNEDDVELIEGVNEKEALLMPSLNAEQKG